MHTTMHVAVTYTALSIIWEEKDAPAAVLTVNGLWSLGSLLAPLVATPFVTHSATVIQQSRGHIHIPYLIIGFYGVFVALQFIIYRSLGWTFSSMDMRCKPAGLSTSSSGDDPASTMSTGSWMPSNRCSLFWITIVTGGFLFILLSISRDNAIMNFGGTIGVESSLQMAPQTASILVTTYNASKGLSRIAAAFICRLMPFQVILMTSAVVPAVMQLVLSVLGLRSVTIYWSLIVCTGLACGPGYSLLFVWMKNYLGKVDPLVNSSLQCGQAVGNFLAIWGSGYILETFGYSVWLSFELVTAIGCMLVFVMLQITVSIRAAKDNKYEALGNVAG